MPMPSKEMFEAFCRHYEMPGTIRTPYHTNDFYDLMLNPEPIPHRVYYAGGRHHHVPPDHFFFAPYDAVWIVPGTGDRP